MILKHKDHKNIPHWILNCMPMLVDILFFDNSNTYIQRQRVAVHGKILSPLPKSSRPFVHPFTEDMDHQIIVINVVVALCKQFPFIVKMSFTREKSNSHFMHSFMGFQWSNNKEKGIMIRELRGDKDVNVMSTKMMMECNVLNREWMVSTPPKKENLFWRKGNWRYYTPKQDYCSDGAEYEF